MNLNFGFLDKLKAYGWMALAITVSALLLVQTLRLNTSKLETAKAVTTLANERTAAAEARSTLNSHFRQAEHTLDAQASQDRTQTNAQVHALSVRNAALLERVRRAEATATIPHLVPGTGAAAGPGQAAGGDPGAELLGTLGEADVREADRGDTIRLHLASCYRQYDRAQAALEALKDPSSKVTQ